MPGCWPPRGGHRAGRPAPGPAPARRPARRRIARHGPAAPATSAGSWRSCGPWRAPGPAAGWHRPNAGPRAGCARRPHRRPDGGPPAADASCHRPPRCTARAAAARGRCPGCAAPVRTRPRSRRHPVPGAPTAVPAGRPRTGLRRPAPRRPAPWGESAGAGCRAGPAGRPGPGAAAQAAAAACCAAAGPGSSGIAAARPCRRTPPEWAAGERSLGPGCPAPRPRPARARPHAPARQCFAARTAALATASSRSGAGARRSAGSGWNHRPARRSCRCAPPAPGPAPRPRHGPAASPVRPLAPGWRLACRTRAGPAGPACRWRSAATGPAP